MAMWGGSGSEWVRVSVATGLWGVGWPAGPLPSWAGGGLVGWAVWPSGGGPFIYIFFGLFSVFLYYIFFIYFLFCFDSF